MGITQNIGASSLIKPGVIDNTAARPASPYEGQVIFQKDTDQLLVWNGTAWVMAIDTDTPPGLELVKTQTIGTAVTSVAVSDVFSATYDSYKIVISGGTGSAGSPLEVVLGSTVTGYYSTLVYSSYAGTAGTVGMSNGTYFGYMGAMLASGKYMSAEIKNPFLSSITFVTGSFVDATNAGSFVGYLNNTTSYTGFTVRPNGGNMTGGTIRVYGYRNS